MLKKLSVVASRVLAVLAGVGASGGGRVRRSSGSPTRSTCSTTKTFQFTANGTRVTGSASRTPIRRHHGRSSS